MKRIFAIVTAGIVFGVIMAGAGIAGNFDSRLIKFMECKGYVAPAMESNASFLAPMPVNYSVIPVYIPMCKHDSIHDIDYSQNDGQP